MKKDPKLHEGHFQRVRLQILHTDVHEIPDGLALEMLLQCPLRRADTNEIARRILKKYGSFNQFCRMVTYEELLTIDGIGESVALKLLCFCKLVKFSVIRQDRILGSDVVSLESIFRFLKLVYRNVMNEEVVLFVMNKYNQILHYQILARGTPERVTIDISEISELARIYHGEKILISHNHPVGTFYPSVADVDTTERIMALCKKKHIEFVDHDLEIDYPREMARIQQEMRELMQREKESQKMLEEAFKGIGYGVE